MARTETAKDKELRLWAKSHLPQQCAVCGSVERLEVDHIYSYSTHPQLRYDTANLQMLCKYHNQSKGSKAPTTRMNWFNEKYLQWEILK